MATYAQDTRFLVLTTPLGKDVLALHSFTGVEAMSRLFSYQLEMDSAKPAIAAKDIVGQNVTWCVRNKDKQPRFFNGFVSRFASGGRNMQNRFVYRAEVVPWLWFLTRTANCRIFQKQNAVQIIEKLFDEFKFKDLMDAPNLKRTPDKREYCVQYRETAFNFVSRLMEEEGIFYYFRHENGKHKLVMSDNTAAYKDCAENKVRYYGGNLAPNHLSEWSHQYEFRPGKWAHTDYNFEDPLNPLLTNTNTTLQIPGMDKFEIFDYPGLYTVKKDGEDEVKIRMQEEEAVHDVVTSAGQCPSFSPGGKFKLDNPDVPAENNKGYVIVSIRHSAADESFGNSAGEAQYGNSFTCIPEAVVFRPTRTTPKPVVNGPQPAVVVGPEGQELYTDKYGRIKVRFHWDREKEKDGAKLKDEDRTCWIRVSQPIAGKRWGMSFWPRIGQEVIVGFHEGDPDRPVILGSLYNADQMPPYQGDGHDDKHKSDNHVSGFKSNTTKGGTGFNELRFDDTKDKQQIFIHAEKNMDTRVKNDSMERVIANRHLIVGYEKDGKKGGDQKEKVFQDKHLHILRNQVEQIEGNAQLTVGKGDAKDGGNLDILVEKKKTETIEKASDLHVKGPFNEKVDGGLSITVGGDIQEKAAGFAHESTKDIYIKAGMNLVIEAGMKLSLKVGGNFVDISAAGVAISGTMVLINSGGAAGTGQAPKPAEPKEAKKAEPADPTQADDSKTGQKSAPG